MCGIAGSLTDARLSEADIVSMTSALSHRGPDAQDVFTNTEKTLALGHTRLSIIDLSSVANQPMRSADGRYVIIFNGEIYNYKSLKSELQLQDPSVGFKTQSDTEVILHGYARWGKDLCARLEGMFALAIWEELQRQSWEKANLLLSG
jgi:asparagine synthase (glutamine-hydrolysing)